MLAIFDGISHVLPEGDIRLPRVEALLRSKCKQKFACSRAEGEAMTNSETRLHSGMLQ